MTGESLENKLKEYLQANLPEQMFLAENEYAIVSIAANVRHDLVDVYDKETAERVRYANEEAAMQAFEAMTKRKQRRDKRAQNSTPTKLDDPNYGNW